MSEVAVMGTSPADSAADEELIRRLYPGLRRFAAVVGASDVDPDDLLQEAVLKVLRRGPISRLEAPGGYLRRAIYTLAADSRREARRRDRALALLAQDDRTRRTEASDLSDLERIAPLDRAILYLVDIEGYRLDEAAALVGLSAVAARSRASRARRRLRREIQQEEGLSDDSA